MARDMNQRFQSTDEFISALDAWIQRGTAVTVPPTADPAAAALLPPGARATLSSASQAKAGQGTGGTWATSQHEELPLKKGPSPGLIAGITLGMVILGGGAAYALLGGKKSSEEPVPAASTAPPAEPSAIEARAEPAPPPASATAPSEISSAAPAVDSVVAPAASAADTQAPATKAAVRPVRPVSGGAKPAAKPAAKPGAKPGSTPDFGY
jgi:hypothetical protein